MTLKKLTLPVLVLGLCVILSIPSLAAASASYHTVSRGDTLYLIAKRYGVSVSSLKAANNLRSEMLYPGQTLIIPSSGGGSGASTGTRYIVQPGDTLWKLSVRFGVSIDAIRSANSLSGDYLHVGQALIIPGSESGTGTKVAYTVQYGDSLYLIAKRFNTTVDQIKQVNGLTSNNIIVGQVLTIPGRSSGSTPPPEASGSTVYIHAVKWGETLESIARYYGVSAGAIASANMMRSYKVESWMALIIPDPTRNTGSLTRITLRSSLSVADYHKLARMTYAEAGSEPYGGQVAVAAVILNRIESPRFPNTMDGVLTQPWQFEPVQNGYYYNTVPSLTAYKAAADAVNGYDPTKGALFFFNPDKITNKWLLSKPVTYRVGSHSFAL